MVPWEGMGDYYRDAARPGGIVSSGVRISSTYWYVQRLTT